MIPGVDLKCLKDARNIADEFINMVQLIGRVFYVYITDKHFSIVQTKLNSKTLKNLFLKER